MQREDHTEVKSVQKMKKLDKLTTAPSNMDASLADVGNIGTEKPPGEREKQAGSVKSYVFVSHS